MTFYAILFSLISLFCFLYSNTKNNTAAFFPLMSAFLLFVIPSSFRAEGLGTDYLGYKLQFYDVANGMDISSQHWEAGFYYLCVFIDKIGLDYHCLFAIMSFFTILFLFLSVSKRSFAIIIPIYALTIYLNTYNGVRQGLTITMGLYAYTLYQKRKYIPAFVILGIGFLFHKSIILLIPIILIANFVKIGKKWSLAFFFISIVAIRLFGMNIVEWIYLNVTEFLGYGDVTTNALNLLITKSNTGYGTLLRIAIFFVMLCLINNIRSANKLNENFLRKVRFLFLVYVFTDLFHAWTLTEFGRVRMVFDIALFIPLATIYNYSKYRKLFFLGYFLWLTMNFYLAAKQNINEVFPYKSLLF